MSKLTKHGTLGESDLVDVREVDVNQILAHKFSNSTSHLFGKVGFPPPDSAVIMERRFTKVWTLEDETGANFVGLNKLNSSSRGRISVPNLSPGVYKLVVRVLKTDASSSLLSLAKQPLGALWSNVNALAAPNAERKEQVLARGMPTEYVQVSCKVTTLESGGEISVAEREELDQSRDELCRMFTIKEAAKADLILQSYSLVKRMRVACDLYRGDLPSQKDMADQGRHLMARAFKPATATGNGGETTKRKRSVYIHEDVDVWRVLRRFYSRFCPEKVEEIPQIADYFANRDGHLGILFATLEDKYGVKFLPTGEWKE